MGRRLSEGPPGILPRQNIQQMVADRMITSRYTIDDSQYQPASLDVRLGETAYRVQCSFVPGKQPVDEKLKRYTIHTVSLIDGAVLEPSIVYIIPLMEGLSLPDGVRAKANPRSTTGRLDIFTRVISDHNDRFDEIAEQYGGPLYLEILSRSFPIRVVRGMSLSQLRFLRGSTRCSDADVLRVYQSDGPFLYEGEDPVGFGEIVLNEGLFLQVDLAGIAGTGLVGYKAKRNSRLIDLTLMNHYSTFDFWDPVYRDSRGQLILERGEFYLLTSKDRVCIPPNYAAEMVAYEETSGELRTHYAGFFDPGFGYSHSGGLKGTVAVMEVRALDAPFMVEDGQRFCKLQLERMAETPDHLYGSTELRSSYQTQGLTPSKHFRSPHPEDIRRRSRDPQQSLFPAEL